MSGFILSRIIICSPCSLAACRSGFCVRSCYVLTPSGILYAFSISSISITALSLIHTLYFPGIHSHLSNVFSAQSFCFSHFSIPCTIFPSARSVSSSKRISPVDTFVQFFQHSASLPSAQPLPEISLHRSTNCALCFKPYMQ